METILQYIFFLFIFDKFIECNFIKKFLDFLTVFGFFLYLAWIFPVQTILGDGNLQISMNLCEFPAE